MERITSRKNPLVARMRALASDRREGDDVVLDGIKLLDEALAAGLELTGVLWAEAPARALDCPAQHTAPLALVQYASPLKNSPGPVFTARPPRIPAPARPARALVLEDVQDPGNLGTVLRGAAAMGVGAVVLCGACADHLSARAARAAMGAAFRQYVRRVALPGLPALLEDWGLPLYGAALGPEAADLRGLRPDRAAVAVGNEGHGLSPGLLALCAGRVRIPMAPGSESLNAAMAATVIMWELQKDRL